MTKSVVVVVVVVMVVVTACVMLTSQDTLWRIMPFLLHDAVYLYIKAVNQTLAEGYADFRDGRLIRNKTIGQRFVGKRSITSINCFNFFILEEFRVSVVLLTWLNYSVAFMFSSRLLGLIFNACNKSKDKMRLSLFSLTYYTQWSHNATDKQTQTNKSYFRVSEQPAKSMDNDEKRN